MTQSQPIRILYMEDDGGAARLFQKKLQPLGYVVDLAQDGETGLTMYDGGQYDVVVVDQSMPVYSGLQVIHQLTGRAPSLPMLMITGTGDEKVAVQAMKLGAGDYIVKDVEGGYLELVPTVIQQLLDRRRLVREKQQAQAALEDRNYHLSLLNQLGQRLSATLSFQQIIRQLLEATNAITGAEGSSVWVWENEERTWLTCQAVLCQGQYFSKVNLSLPSTQGLVGQVARTLKSAYTGDSVPDNTDYPDATVYVCLTARSILAVPLRVRDALTGILEVANNPDGPFTEDEQFLVETLAASAATAMENARLVETLRQQARDLQAQNEDLDAFAHTVAHDLKNPLGLIVGYTQLLLDDKGTLSEAHHSYIEQIMFGGHRMDNIIHELLLLAEIRQVDVELMPLDMRNIVDEVQARMHDLIAQHKATITVPESWPSVSGYAPWVEEVWVNYLSNALKYGSQPPEIELGATSLRNGMVRLWLRNKGAELMPEERAHLFKPFQRLNQVQVKGHGLGLSIVRRIAEKLGGEVGVANEPGYGPIFSFTLPILETAEI